MRLPRLGLQSWDIALGDEGPVLQEVQGGDFESPQIAPSANKIVGSSFGLVYLRSHDRLFLTKFDGRPTAEMPCSQ